ncbi:hypothetical protein QBC38DRAFT_352760 [Podospora fimiseda]|uniref:Signal transduction histidine-protein kinase n=1 Tax=Podospora fimiseda TaxID=252190 RepID=A0AAN7BZD0_9PEZI|nr:hypothetical protein QBC38DRAFT_352760 [Podospora fimiseda]
MKSTPLLDASIIDLLEADPRPSLIVAYGLPPHPPAVVYTNPAFGTQSDLQTLITHQHDHQVLWDWVTSPQQPPPGQESPAPAKGGGSFMYMNAYWTRSLVTREIIVVGANELPPNPPTPTIHILTESLTTPLPSPAVGPCIKSTTFTQPTNLPNSVQFSGPSPSDAGWIPSEVTPGKLVQALLVFLPCFIFSGVLTLPVEQQPFIDVVSNVNWAATPLGPMTEWPKRLEQTFKQILADSRPISICWGPSLITLYNEAFAKLCGSQHPAMLGMPVEKTWNDAGPLLKQKLRSVSPKQRGALEDEWRFFVERDSETKGGPKWLEEVYLKFQILPITENGDILGFTHAVAETTGMRLWERRMKMLIDLGDNLVTARDVSSYWEKTLQQLAAVEPLHDIPMAIMYSVEDDTDSAAPAAPQGGPAKLCRLAGTLAVPEQHPVVLNTIKLGTGQDTLAAIFRKSLTAPHPLLLQSIDGTLPQTLLQGMDWRRSDGVPCRAAVVLPIRPTKRENVMGLLVLGLNPRRPYDHEYRQYVSLLSQKLATSLASVVLLEEEARRGRSAAQQAAYDRAVLQKELEFQTKEANESLQLFEAVAKFVPVGMSFSDPDGQITFANDAWHEITGCTQADGPISTETFLKCVKEEDRGIIIDAHKKIITESSRSTEFEFRVKGRVDLPLMRRSPSFETAGLDLVSIGELTERHVHAISRAERAPDGKIIRVLTCLTDVTVHKRTAEEAVWRAQQAENLKRMAEFATVGMCDMNLDGRLLGANNVFYEMCGLEKADPSKVNIKPWETAVVPEDSDLINEKVAKMVAEDRVQIVEVRLRTTWASEDGKLTLPRWVQATMMPVRSTEGVIQSFTGCLSDVSLQKWQLEVEKERKEEAIESRRHQENFIDMTSHEMRNPLSAIIHCADAITATLGKVLEIIGPSTSSPDLNFEIEDWHAEIESLLASSIDSAETIVDCAQHQKRIVDDILTMSKLDSNLLAITPTTVNPIVMVREALKMFEIEARRDDINLDMDVAQSYKDLNITYLDFDPSRLKQILINLLTNALKFTNRRPTKHVSVTVSASLSRPTEATSRVQFIPRSQDEGDEDDSSGNDNRGDSVFLMFEVNDTGQGLSEEEQRTLFQRFVQASSRTHVNHGGSGLGLFISRRLTEFQGGQIGVASQPGVGSTFAFYTEAFRPSEEAIKEAETNSAVTTAARAPAVAIARRSVNGVRSRNTSDSATPTSDCATPTSLPEASTSATTPITKTSSSLPYPLRRIRRSPAVDSRIRGVLIVEDNRINQWITRRGLENMGVVVDVAEDGVECLQKLRSSDRYIESDSDDDDEDEGEGGGAPITLNSPTCSAVSSQPESKFSVSVILMDIEMPVLDGLKCTKTIRDLERAGKITGGRIPIIAVSANAKPEQINEALAAGCDEVMTKPYHLVDLMERIKQLVSSAT